MGESKVRVCDCFDEKSVVNMNNALNDMRIAIGLGVTRNGEFYSSVANKYRDMLIEYGMYCKDDEVDRWIGCCQYLIDSISHCEDTEWLYDAWIMEATAKLLYALDGEIDWDRVHDIVREQGHTCGTISEVSQLLLDFSPCGVEFVEHEIKPRAIFSEMKGLKSAYNTEVGNRKRKEKRERKELGSRLVKVLNDRVISLEKCGE